MLKIILIYVFLPGIVWSMDAMIGPGRWLVLNIVKCPEHEKYGMSFDISRKKVNRTHDGFNGHLMLDFTISDDYGVHIDVCKYVDGGCKQYQILKDDCMCCLLRKYARENMAKGLGLAGIDPPDCPIPKGEYDLQNFVFDYGELPDNGIYGVFDAKATLLAKNKLDVLGCLVITLEFEKEDETE